MIVRQIFKIKLIQVFLLDEISDFNIVFSSPFIRMPLNKQTYGRRECSAR